MPWKPKGRPLSGRWYGIHAFDDLLKLFNLVFSDVLSHPVMDADMATLSAFVLRVLAALALVVVIVSSARALLAA
jgi:hypothetical protein